VFAVAVLASRSMDRTEAFVMLGLFMTSFVSSWVFIGPMEETSRLVVGVMYIVLAIGLLIRHWDNMRTVMVDGLKVPYAEMAEE